MNRNYLITALHASVHAPFLGSKVMVSLLAVNLDPSQTTIGAVSVLWINALDRARCQPARAALDAAGINCR